MNDEITEEATTALATTERGLLRRDASGLMGIQRLYLQELAATGSPKQARKILNIKDRRVRGWFQEDDFLAAYNDLFGSQDLEVTRQEIQLIYGKTADVYDDALEAYKWAKFDVECPECHHEWQESVRIEDWSTRLKAAEAMGKITGLMKERKQVDTTVTHLTAAESIALLAYRSGMREIPKPIRMKLIDLGLIEED